MTQVSVLRLHLLRAGYALLIVGLGIAIWPGILNPAKTWEMMHGVVVCMLGAMSALAIVGIRHPLRMLPLLFFELAWKTIWLIRIALPLWLNHRMDASYTETAAECLMAVVFVCVIPWDYVFSTFIKGQGDSWRAQRAPAESASIRA